MSEDTIQNQIDKPLFHITVDRSTNGHDRYEILLDYSMGKLVKITSLVGAFLATFSAVLHFII
jgi:hypothetical protein